MCNTWGQEYIRRYTVHRMQSVGVKAHLFCMQKKGKGLTGKRMRGSAGQHSQPRESRTVLELEEVQLFLILCKWVMRQFIILHESWDFNMCDHKRWVMRCLSIYVYELCSIWNSCLWFHDTINTLAVYRSPGYPWILYIGAHTVNFKSKTLIPKMQQM